MEKETLSQQVLKQTIKNNIKSTYSISKSITNIGIVAISNKEIREFIVNGLHDIGLGALILTEDIYEKSNIASIKKLNPNDMYGFDFFVYDNDHEGIDVVGLMKAGVVPIMPEKNTYSSILKDFNPMKFEGNGFFWKRNSPYCIFEKIITYLENIKFPEDKRTLIKNINDTF